MPRWVQTISHRTLVNGVAIFGGEAFSRLATFVMALIVARRFGPVALGQYGYALAVASVLLIVPDFGLHLLTTRDLVVEPQRLWRTFWSLHWLKLILAGGVAALTVLFGEGVVQDEGRRFLLYLLVARALLQTFSQAYMAIFKAFERMHYIALQQLVGATVAVACAGVALTVRGNLFAVVSCLLVGQAVETWIGWQIVLRRFKPGDIYGWDAAFLRQMLVAAAPIGLTIALQALNLRLDVLALGFFASNLELGRFQAAAWFLVGTFLCASLLMNVVFPKLSRLLQEPSERGRAYVESLLKHGSLVVTFGAVIVWLGAPWILRWFYGPALSGAAVPLRILAPALPFMFINTILFYVFVATRRRAVYLGTLGFGVGLGALLSVALAQRYGAAGVAFADTVREFIMTGIFLFCLKREHLAPDAGRGLLRVYLGAAGATLALAVVAKSIGPTLEWPAAWNLLMLAGTLIFVGLPDRQELSLLVDENS
jgi:O-antigen/teichoic acid export membrane protein